MQRRRSDVDGLLRLNGQADVDGFASTVANQLERDSFAGTLLAKRGEQVLDRGEWLSGDRDEDVTGGDVSLVRGSPGESDPHRPGVVLGAFPSRCSYTRASRPTWVGPT